MVVFVLTLLPARKAVKDVAFDVLVSVVELKNEITFDVSGLVVLDDVDDRNDAKSDGAVALVVFAVELPPKISKSDAVVLLSVGVVVLLLARISVRVVVLEFSSVVVFDAPKISAKDVVVVLVFDAPKISAKDVVVFVVFDAPKISANEVVVVLSVLVVLSRLLSKKSVRLPGLLSLVLVRDAAKGDNGAVSL